MDNKYPILSYVIKVIKFLAVISIISGLYSTIKSDISGELKTAAAFFIVSFNLCLYAYAEFLKVHVDQEYNGRKNIEVLEALLSETQKQNKAVIPKTPVKPPAKPRIKTPQATAEQQQKIKDLINRLHSEGISAEEIVKEMVEGSVPTLEGNPIWTIEAVNSVLTPS
jgi:hypothetical protein